MAWKNYLQLRQEYADPEFQRAFAELFTLRLFLQRCLVPEGYIPPDKLGDAISLSGAGREWVPYVRAEIPGISTQEINLALFLEFFHHDLFIDLSTTNAQEIQQSLHDEMLNARIRYPWVYERLLYDRFFEMFPTETETLSYEQTVRLLQGTPQGVFQIGQLVAGPFGIVTSFCHRSLRPTLTVPLWHCSDPSCNALHPVLLCGGRNRVGDAAKLIAAESERRAGPPTEWDKYCGDLIDVADWYDDMHPGKLPSLLANALSEAEIRSLLGQLLRERSREIRERIGQARVFQEQLTGSSEDIAKRLSKAQCFQLVLLMSDEVLARTVESVVEARTVRIPATEVRTVGVAHGRFGAFNVTWELSRFGLRAMPVVRDIALARLKHLIRELYSEEEARRDLAWKLRHVAGETIYEKLDRYVHKEDPRRAVGDLVLASREKLDRAFAVLRYGKFEVPSVAEEEERLVERILWKLGFEVGPFPTQQRLFWERLEKFLGTARGYSSYNEKQMELIRSIGVNFFVSLEEILDASLSFAAWALMSDHYAETKFKCNLDDARRFMARSLSGRRMASGEALLLDSGGKNTLYPLIQGFSVLADALMEVIGRGKELERAGDVLPGFCGKTSIELFPFRHRALVLDLREQDRGQVIGFLKEITAKLEASQIANIRNRIEHRRQDFPKREEIERACGEVATTVDRMEASGLYPVVYIYGGRTVDEYGRGVVIFKDYRGRELRINRPSQFGLCGLPGLEQPQIIVPWMHLGDSSELLRFQFEEVSDYVEMRRGYPKRRARSPSRELEKKLEAEEKQAKEQVA